MRAHQRSASRPLHDYDPISDGRPLPPRIVALQVAADDRAPDLQGAGLLALLASGIGLTFAWILLPDRAPFAHALLSAATVLYAAGGAWLLRRHCEDVAAAPPPATIDTEHFTRTARPDTLPRDFERFVNDGILASRRRGRTVALLRLAFVLPDLVLRDRDDLLETIAEEARDMTRAYDYVQVPDDGTILIFLAHVQPDADRTAIAARIVEDLRRCGGPAGTALCTQVQCAGLEQESDTATQLVERVVDAHYEILGQ